MMFSRSTRLRNRAFTMVELMGAVTIALLIIIMLYSIFDKVQKVFVTGQNRALAMEEGRTAMDMVVGDFKIISGGVDGSLKNLNWMPYPSPRPQATASTPARPIPVPLRIGEKVIINPGYFTGWIGTITATNTPMKNNLCEMDLGIFGVIQTNRVFASMNFRAPDDVFVVGPVGFMKPSTGDFVTTDALNIAAPANLVPEGARLDLYHHNVRFLTNDSSWRVVHYRFGASDDYEDINPAATPVGALWVYRSPNRVKGQIKDEFYKHLQLQNDDRLSRGRQGLNEPMGFAKLIDGVIHFRVRAITPDGFQRRLKEYGYSNNPFGGFNLPSHIEVELAVLDKKLLKEVQNGMEQQLEGQSDQIKRDERFKYITQNLDKVYFFKQLIQINSNTEGL